MAETTLCRLEWMQPDGTWFQAHAGIELLHPDGYVKRLAARGKIARVTNLETGEVIGAEEYDII